VSRPFPTTLLDFQRSVLGIAATVEGPTYDALYGGRWTHPNR
jgi:hypothetical protein